MTREQIRQALALYRNRFIEFDISPREFRRDYNFPLGVADSYPHCYWMLGRIEQFLDEDKVDIARHLLGFIQGVLWMHGLYTIDELNSHNCF